ncbi:hypothetical protein [Hoeflea prorocentri]|uniref:Glycerophosphoryl diester phosphodiesterase membrane domain-containing protein n=1 Tax=Hoeflea prorocentri TaxID=1922333 RepID=A0A9X3ULK3_9HYPH|nr:hypothetical protein [Hoeflea prorocentri]MCY6383477.1 hypothetical protein [Hoeflea prorocentri]MDA5401277.1 hypothetical protein [Hoeflea prorocentri]
MGYRIFALCLKQVFGHLGVALRLSWFWLLLGLLLFLGFFGMFGGLDQQAGSEGVQPHAGPPVFLTLLLSIATMVVFLLGGAVIAIGWHRFVLLDEEPQNFFVLRRQWSIGTYVIRGLLIMLILAAVFLPLLLILVLVFGSVIFGSVTNEGGSSNSLFVMAAFLLLVNVAATWVILRIGLVLPTIAVDKRISFGESIRLTRHVAGPLLVTAVCIVVFNFIPTFLFEIVSTQSTALEIVRMAFTTAFSWISFLVSIGILTVVYGHCAENRPV